MSLDSFSGRVHGVEYFRVNPTESYVEIPPALMITARDGSMFTLGTEYVQHGQTFEFNVLCNDRDTGEMASKIVFQRGIVRIFGQAGWRVWSERSKRFI
jgi:hypothetical protein